MYLSVFSRARSSERYGSSRSPIRALTESTRRAAQQSVVLLKNRNDVLPLSKKGQKVALVGWWANDTAEAEGCGVIWGNASYAVTVEAGLVIHEDVYSPSSK